MTTVMIDRADLCRPARHIFLSPHYDDIALSCGGTAALVAGAGRSTEVLLIFGDHPDSSTRMTDFAESLHAKWGLTAAQVIAGRRAEESGASRVLGTTTRFLPFRDAIYRGSRYLNDDQLFGSPAADESDLHLQIIDRSGLAGHVDPEARVYAPLAIGNHVDHQHAYRAGVVLAGKGWDVWFYEDLPYGLRPELVASRIAALRGEAEPGVLAPVEESWPAKIDAIMAYPSQLGVIFEEYVGVGSTKDAIDQAMAEYARHAGAGTAVERFWTVALKP